MTTNLTRNYKIAAALMIKNEEKTIVSTLQSLSQLDGIIIFDTGSTDDTLNLVSTFSQLPLHLKRGTFVDFAVSRNELLDFANEICQAFQYDYILLVDANDILHGQLPDRLDHDAYYVKHVFDYNDKQLVEFYNIKLIKVPTTHRYKQPTHEYLDGCSDIQRLDIEFHQNRRNDDKRVAWTWDKKILEKEFEKDPSNARVVFYLAQTCNCLGEKPEAKHLYEKRTTMGGYIDEIYESWMKLSGLSEGIEKLNALHSALNIHYRVEPLVKIAEYWRKKENYLLAYAYSKEACHQPLPSYNLFTDKMYFDYFRWFELSISAFYVQMFDVGKMACEKILETGIDKELNEKNFEFYKKD